MVNEFHNLDMTINSTFQLCYDYPRNASALATLINWSNHRTLNQETLAEVCKKISDNEGIMSPIRREKYFISALLCGLFRDPLKEYNEINKKYINGDYLGSKPFSKQVILSLFSRYLLPNNRSYDQKNIAMNYHMLRRTHHVLVDSSMKPYLMRNDVTAATVHQANELYETFKGNGYVASRGLLWMCLYLAGTKLDSALAVEVCKDIERKLLKNRLIVNPDDYILIGYIAGKSMDVDAVCRDFQHIQPAMEEVSKSSGFGLEVLLFFAANRIVIEGIREFSDEEIYDYILVMNQLVLNNEISMQAMNAL